MCGDSRHRLSGRTKLDSNVDAMILQNPGDSPRMIRPKQLAFILLTLLLTTCTLIAQETTPPPVAAPPGQTAAPAYTPKFRGDPARSDSEAEALGYMRVVMRAEVGFNKHYGHYALNLHELVHSGTFTQRMVNPDRGDYTVGYKGKKDNFILTMTPKMMDAQHRSFYADNDGKIHADETKAADENSPVIETHRW
jgi:hypothetical protein